MANKSKFPSPDMNPKKKRREESPHKGCDKTPGSSNSKKNKKNY